MEIAAFLIDFILHIDKHLQAFVVAYGPWVYALLFLIVFVETGGGVMPVVHPCRYDAAAHPCWAHGRGRR